MSVKMVSHDFQMDSFVSVEAPEGTDPETLRDEAKAKFATLIADGHAVLEYVGVFDDE